MNTNITILVIIFAIIAIILKIINFIFEIQHNNSKKNDKQFDLQNQINFQNDINRTNKEFIDNLNNFQKEQNDFVQQQFQNSSDNFNQF